MKVSLVTASSSLRRAFVDFSRQMQVYFAMPFGVGEMLARVDAISVEEVRRTGAAMLHRRLPWRRSARSAGFTSQAKIVAL